MSNLVEFEVLDISGENYLTWALDVGTHLRTKGLLNTINKSKESSYEDKAKAHVFIMDHLHKSLKNEYITTKDPADLWSNLKSRYDQQEHVMVPKLPLKSLHSYDTAEEYDNSGMRKHDSHHKDSATLQVENKISPDRNHKRGHRSVLDDKACNFYLFSCYFLCCDRYSD